MAIVGLQLSQDAPLAKLAIQHFAHSEATIERYSLNSYDNDGRHERGIPELINISCVCQPVSVEGDKKTISNEYGEYTDGGIVVWYEGEIYTSDNKGSSNHEGHSDVIIFKGTRYKVVSVKNRYEGANFCRAVCMIIEDQNGEIKASSGRVNL